jgi:hypothetical protein
MNAIILGLLVELFYGAAACGTAYLMYRAVASDYYYAGFFFLVFTILAFFKMIEQGRTVEKIAEALKKK